MIDKVKSYVKHELNNISKGFDGSLALERAYGAICLFWTVVGMKN